MTEQEKAFVEHLKKMCPELATSPRGRAEYSDATLLSLYHEMLYDWQVACWWAWQNPEEGAGMGPPLLPKKRPQRLDWVQDAYKD